MNYLFFAIAVILFLPSAYDVLLLLQQNSYVFVTKQKFWIGYSILTIIVAIATILTVFVDSAFSIAFFASAALAAVLYAAKRFTNSRGKVSVTKRLKRLFCFSLALFIIISVCTLLFAPLYALTVLILLPQLLVLISALILFPFEKKNNKRYEKMLVDKLATAPHLIRVGITGSAGKTSVKNILFEMLSTRFRVLKTDKNFNTPLGLWLTVKEKNLSSYDIFIAEMGARKTGDIKELVALVKPDAGIITSVLPQHLETFKTIKAITDEKSELVRGILSGIVVLNADDENVKNMAKVTLSEVITVGEDAMFQIKNVKADYSGTSFAFCAGGKEIFLKTDLLGKHNATNIALAAALALRFGIPEEDIKFAVEGLKPVPHRLEMLKTEGGGFILDDGYNGNIKGTENALEIVATFPGKRIIFSQGLVELGVKEHEENVALGKKMAGVADIIILTGRLGEYINEGLANSDAEIIRVKDVKEGREKLKILFEPGDLLYLQNDLPELYR